MNQNQNRPWEIWLVHHSHVDIGYTEPQEVILRKHAEFVAQALDACTATDSLPEGERFCWTCEVSWTVKVFLARFPERKEEFFRRVREGRIEVTALYLQSTDLFTLELLEQTTEYAVQLAHRHDFEVRTAMNDDVNGWAWGLPDLLSRCGVRFMDVAINETRALDVRPRPRPLRWTGPAGGSLLFWHGEHYLQGNGLEFTRPGAETRVAEHLKRLEKDGYPHSVVELRIHGENHDNAPPGLWLSAMVRDWNARHATPKLRLVTPRTWFAEVETHWPEALTEYCAGWPDWWADGNGTAAAESKLVRAAQADLMTLNALTVATGWKPSPDRVEKARDAAAFFCEHTWGAWCSTDTPDSLTSRAQWNTKAGYAYTAAVEAGSLVRDTLAEVVEQERYDKPFVLVFNPLQETRSGLVELMVADADLGLPSVAMVPTPLKTEPGPAFHLVDEETGALVPVHREPAIADSARRSAQLFRFLGRQVPACGVRRYRVEPGEASVKTACVLRGGRLESPHVSVGFSPNGAGIASVRTRAAGMEWVRTPAEFALGEAVYESIPGPFGREKLADWNGIKRDCPFVRTRLRLGAPEYFERPFGAGCRLRALDLPGSLKSFSLEVTVYDDLPCVDLAYRLDKMPESEAESLYVAFPLGGGLAGNQTEVWLDVPGALMRPGLDQVPGSATDWHSLQHGFAVSGGEVGVVVASPDIPLVQVNGINTGKWQETLPPHDGTVMSWIFNNYWFTNFPAAQGGALEWRYRLSAWGVDFALSSVLRFLSDVRQPILGQVKRFT